MSSTPFGKRKLIGIVESTIPKPTFLSISKIGLRKGYFKDYRFKSSIGAGNSSLAITGSYLQKRG
jgi:hypothetical protein